MDYARDIIGRARATLELSRKRADGGSCMKVDRASKDQESRRLEHRVIDDALNEALMATFPASDPLSIVSSLIAGSQDKIRKAQIGEAVGDRPEVPNSAGQHNQPILKT